MIKRMIIAFASLIVTSAMMTSVYAHVPRCPVAIVCQGGCTIIDGTPGDLNGWIFSGSGGVASYNGIAVIGSDGGLLRAQCHYDRGILYSNPGEYDPDAILERNKNFRATHSGIVCNGSTYECSFE